MLFHNRTILPGGFRVAGTLTDLTSTGSDDSVAQNDFAWVKDQQAMYTCTSVTPTTSVWQLAEGGQGAIRIAATVTELNALGSANGVAVGDVAWVQAAQTFYVATTVNSTTSVWNVATGIGDVKAAANVTFTGNVSFANSVNLSNQKIFNLGPPTAGGDAVNKTYADTTFIKRDGSNNFLGDVDVNSHRIINLVGPFTSNTEVVNKAYVDGAVAALGAFTPLYKYDENNTSFTPSLTDLSDPTSVYLTLAVSPATSIALVAGTYRFTVSYIWKNPVGSIAIRVERSFVGPPPATVTVIPDFVDRNDVTSGSEAHVSTHFAQQIITTPGNYNFTLRVAKATGLANVTMLSAKMDLLRVL